MKTPSHAGQCARPSAAPKWSSTHIKVCAHLILLTAAPCAPASLGLQALTAMQAAALASPAARRQSLHHGAALPLQRYRAPRCRPVVAAATSPGGSTGGADGSKQRPAQVRQAQCVAGCVCMRVCGAIELHSARVSLRQAHNTAPPLPPTCCLLPALVPTARSSRGGCIQGCNGTPGHGR